jgi:hypothetical protein
METDDNDIEMTTIEHELDDLPKLRTRSTSGDNFPVIVIRKIQSFNQDFRVGISNMGINRMPSFMEECELRENTKIRQFERFMNNIFENPDAKFTMTQRVILFINLVFELYKLCISSFLIVFVPQLCPDGKECSIYNNIVPRDNLETAAIAFNASMSVYFVLLFFFERRREKIIMRHLRICRESPTDKEHLVKTLCDLQKEHRKQIILHNNVYREMGKFLIVMFIINVSLSWTVIYKNYLNNNTYIVFTTNALFVIQRIYRVLVITTSGEYNIYSAYRNENLVYNELKFGEGIEPAYVEEGEGYTSERFEFDDILG